MELLLNLMWLALSVTLGVLLVASRSKRGGSSREFTYSRSTVWVAYLVLIALLLPAISMTDDLMAMVTPTDGEQIVRRYDAPNFFQHHPAVARVVFHITRDRFPAPLVGIDRVETVTDFSVLPLPPAWRAQDRAPPTVV